MIIGGNEDSGIITGTQLVFNENLLLELISRLAIGANEFADVAGHGTDDVAIGNSDMGLAHGHAPVISAFKGMADLVHPTAWPGRGIPGLSRCKAAGVRSARTGCGFLRVLWLTEFITFQASP